MSPLPIPARISAIQAPIVPIIAGLIESNPGTISLGQGVVHYGPPPEIAARLQRFLLEPANHRYSPDWGIAPLIDALAEKVRGENDVDMATRALVVTAGANMGFVNAVLAITDPGDEVVLLSPYYFNHDMAVRLAGCTPRFVSTDAALRPDVAAIERALGPRTRAVVTISPNNPTGVAYPAEDIRAVNALCRRHGLYHINDEAYEYFVYDGARHYCACAAPDSTAHTISLFSMSKSYGFASWRIGYMVVPEALFDAVMKIQDTNVICAPVVSQHAALACLERGPEYCRGFLDEICEVRRRVLESLGGLGELVSLPSANGALYVYLRVNRPWDSYDVCRDLIRRYRVAVVPGLAFGSDDACYLRVSYGALLRDAVDEGIGRLVSGLAAMAR